LIKNKIITPNINGSVGNENPMPNSNSFKLTERGVKKTIININLSRAKKYIRKMRIATGIKSTQYSSLEIK